MYPLTVRLALYHYSVPLALLRTSLGKTVENAAPQKAKITHLYYFIYTKTDTSTSRKIFVFIAPKSAFSQASSQVLSKVESAQDKIVSDFFLALFTAENLSSQNSRKLKVRLTTRNPPRRINF